LKIAPDLTIFNAIVLQISCRKAKVTEISPGLFYSRSEGPKFAEFASLVANELEAEDEFIASSVVSQPDVLVDIIQFDGSICKIILLTLFYFFNHSKLRILGKNKMTMF